MNRVEMAEQLESWAKELRNNRLIMPPGDLTVAEAVAILDPIYQGFEIEISVGKSKYGGALSGPAYVLRENGDYKTAFESTSLRGLIDQALAKHQGKETTLAELDKQLATT